MAEPYEVGYGRPPKHTRFQKGQSGNPEGRPRGSKGLRTVLFEELEAKIDLKVGGRRTRMSQQRVVIKSLINKAAKGNFQAAGKLFELYFKVMRLDEASTDAHEPLTSDELAVLKHLERRILEKAAEDDKAAEEDGS